MKGRLRGTPLMVKLVAAVLALVAAALIVISVSTAFLLHSYLVDRVDAGLSTLLDQARVSIPNADPSLPTDYLIVAADKSRGMGSVRYDQGLTADDLPPALNSASWYEKH